MRPVLVLVVVVLTAAATLGSGGSALAECEPGQTHMYCGPSQHSGTSNDDSDETSVGAQVANELFKTHSNAQQTPMQLDQTALASESAEAQVGLLDPDYAEEVRETRQMTEAEADRLFEEMVDTVYEAVESAVTTAVEEVADVISDGLGKAKELVNDLFRPFG